MPQASEELRTKWGGLGGVGEDKAIAFLKAAGYKLRRDWLWVKPGPSYAPTNDEIEAMDFLIYEWDFGGITTEIL